MRVFILKKYNKTLSDVQVSFQGNKVVIVGNLLLFGSRSPFVAAGELNDRDGRFIDLVRPKMDLNGMALSPVATASVLKQINPVLDIVTDLDLEGYLSLSQVVVGIDAVTVYGRAGIPLVLPLPTDTFSDDKSKIRNADIPSHEL